MFHLHFISCPIFCRTLYIVWSLSFLHWYFHFFLLCSWNFLPIFSCNFPLLSPLPVVHLPFSDTLYLPLYLLVTPFVLLYHLVCLSMIIWSRKIIFSRLAFFLHFVSSGVFFLYYLLGGRIEFFFAYYRVSFPFVISLFLFSLLFGVSHFPSLLSSVLLPSLLPCHLVFPWFFHDYLMIQSKIIWCVPTSLFDIWCNSIHSLLSAFLLYYLLLVSFSYVVYSSSFIVWWLLFSLLNFSLFSFLLCLLFLFSIYIIYSFTFSVFCGVFSF